MNDQPIDAAPAKIPACGECGKPLRHTKHVETWWCDNPRCGVTVRNIAPFVALASEAEADGRDWRTALNLATAHAEDWLRARNDIKAALAAARAEADRDRVQVRVTLAEADRDRDELRIVLSEARDAIVHYQARVAKIEAQHLAYADITQKRIGDLEGAEGLRGLIASASNLVGVVRNKQWERVASKADILDFAINRARALLGDSTPEPACDR